MEKKLYYKVVQRATSSHETHLVSCITGSPDVDTNLRGPQAVIYKIGKWARPNIEKSKLFVFAKFDDAYEFADGQKVIYPLSIYQCEVINPKRITTVLAIYQSGPDKIEQFWRNHWKQLPQLQYQIAPHGTLTVSAVKLMSCFKTFM